MLMGVTVISTFATGVPLRSLSTTITDITPNSDSVGALSKKSSKKIKNRIILIL